MQPIDRFSNDTEVLIDALNNQYLVHGDRAAATELAKVATLSQHLPGTTVIHQGAADNAILFLLFGEVSIVINGRELANRPAGLHVGEMAMIDPSVRRSAAVIARDTIVVGCRSHSDPAAIAVVGESVYE